MMDLTIEQLKFARDIGATHINTNVNSGFVDREFYRKDRAAYIDGKWDYGWSDLVLLDDPHYIFEKIDFSPLDDYYADKELDIVAAGGDTELEVPVARIITVPQDALIRALHNLARAYRMLGGLDVAFDSELLVAEALLSKIGINKGGKI